MGDVNEVAVERRQRQLLSAYGEVPIERETVPLPADRYRDHATAAREGYLGGGYVWVVRAAGQGPDPSEDTPTDLLRDTDRVLLVVGRGSGDQWSIPGGGQEGDESFESAARREVFEETGIDCEVTGLFKIQHLTAVPTDPVAVDDDDAIHSLYAFFEGKYRSGQIAIQESELHGAAWFADLPDPLHPAIADRAEDWESEAAESDPYRRL